MKERVSITIEEEISKKIKKMLDSSSKYRNRSHIIEMAIEKFVEAEGKNEK